MIENALKSLGMDEYVLSGNPQNEKEFNEYFKKVIGTDANDTVILSSNPSTFGVTWEQVNNQIEIEEQKYKDTQYQRDRKTEYDALNQLEMQFDDWDAWKAAVNEIKAKYPKPE